MDVWIKRTMPEVQQYMMSNGRPKIILDLGFIFLLTIARYES